MGCSAKAAVLNHCFVVGVSRPTGLPVASGRSTLMLVLARFTPALGLMWNPERQVVMPPTCHPPITASTRRFLITILRPLPNGKFGDETRRSTRAKELGLSEKRHRRIPHRLRQRVRGGFAFRHSSNRWLSCNKSSRTAVFSRDMPHGTTHPSIESRTLAERTQIHPHAGRQENHPRNTSSTFRNAVGSTPAPIRSSSPVVSTSSRAASVAPSRRDPPVSTNTKRRGVSLRSRFRQE